MTIAVTGAIQLANQVTNALRQTSDTASSAAKYLKTGSLIDLTGVARVEPILLIDSDVLNVDFLNDVLQSLHAQFTGYYVQALDVLGSVGSVSVAGKLAPLNPNRKLGMESDYDATFNANAYKYRLPMPHIKPSFSMESYSTHVSTPEDVSSIIRENTNLSVGKLVPVTLREGNQEVRMKMAIRLMANNVPTSTMVDILTHRNHFDMDMKERWYGVKSGRLGFIKDFILCQDLIDKERKARIRDKSGVYNEIASRGVNNVVQGLVSKNPSMNTASNLAVISSDTLAQVELKMGGKFSNMKVRQSVFDNTLLMIIAVIDKGWERVTFYYRGLDGTTQLSASALKSSNNKGPDITDIFKAFMAGSNPSL